MQFPQRRNDKSPDRSKGTRRALALQLDRAAHDLNPILVIFAVGLMVLNLTLYIGMAAAGEPFVWTQPHQIGSRGAPAAMAASPEQAGYAR
jgi:hypothetical protein